MGIGAALIGGGALVASSVASGVIGASAAKSAANTQAQAASQAEAIQRAEFGTTQQNMAPFVAAGATALPQLQKLTGTDIGGNPNTAPLTAPFQPTMAQLAQTPGYQFTLNQGLLAAQNGFAAQGLGTSGAAAKGAVNYAEGLAGTTYQNQFQNYLAQNQQRYNMLGGIAGSGQNAAAGLGSLALQSAGQIGNTIQAGGQATAAGDIGAANALGGAVSNIGSGVANLAAQYGTLSFFKNNPGLFGSRGLG